MKTPVRCEYRDNNEVVETCITTLLVTSGPMKYRCDICDELLSDSVK